MKITPVTSLVQDGLNKATSATKKRQFVSAFRKCLSDSPASEIQMGGIRVGQNVDTFIWVGNNYHYLWPPGFGLSGCMRGMVAGALGGERLRYSSARVNHLICLFVFSVDLRNGDKKNYNDKDKLLFRTITSSSIVWEIMIIIKAIMFFN